MPEDILNEELEKLAENEKQKSHYSWFTTAVLTSLLIAAIYISWPVIFTRFPEQPLLTWHHAFITLFHELGHAFFMPLLFIPIIGKTSIVAFIITFGGTFAQLFLSSLVAILGYKERKHWIGSLPGIYWLGVNFMDISYYINDATCRCAGSYLSLSEGFSTQVAEQDWTYMLGHLGILSYDHAIATVFYWIGIIIILSVLAGLGYHIVSRLSSTIKQPSFTD